MRCLSEFAFRGVNLTKIESRPLRMRLGHYRFFVDCEGSAGEPSVAEAVDGLRKHCEQVRILGSYACCRCRLIRLSRQSWRTRPRHQAQGGSRRIRSTGGADVSLAVCSS